MRNKIRLGIALMGVISAITFTSINANAQVNVVWKFNNTTKYDGEVIVDEKTGDRTFALYRTDMYESEKTYQNVPVESVYVYDINTPQTINASQQVSKNNSYSFTEGISATVSSTIQAKYKGKVVDITASITASVTGSKSTTYANSDTTVNATSATLNVDGEKVKFGVYAGYYTAYRAKATKYVVTCEVYNQHYVPEAGSGSNYKAGYYEEPVKDTNNSFTQTYYIFTALKYGTNAYAFNSFKYFENMDKYMNYMNGYTIVG